MTVDLGLEELLKKENEEFQSKNASTSSSCDNEQKKSEIDFVELAKCYEKKDFKALRSKIEEFSFTRPCDLLSHLILKCYELILNFQEEKLPSFIMLAPFGELCENIKKIEKNNQNSNQYNEVLRLGKIIYDKFYENLKSLNEQDLLGVLIKYKPIFPVVNEATLFLETNNYSKRTKEFIEDVTMSKIHTKKRMHMIWTAFWIILISGSIIIYKNETFGFRKAKNNDFLSLEKINYEFNFDKNEIEKLKQKFSISNEEMKSYTKNNDDLASSLDDKKKDIEPIFSLGMYEIIKEAQVRIKPNKKAKIIGKFSKGDRIKVVGKEGKYYKIASKDNEHFGYVLSSHTKFLIGINPKNEVKN